ncbi:MAG: ATP synthase F0 subunit C [Proteobacteria bacterium]|jgi:F-type H+-transporting ATPase subunit c|nr:ATP synthase F0 subunit C [Pseudomonadota bacterium]
MKNIAKVLMVVMASLMASSAFAEEATTAGTAAAAATGFTNAGLASFAAFLGLGLAAIGGAIGQSRVASAALEGIARNPQASDKIFTPLILALAFIESLVIYALVIALIKT